MSGSKFNHSFGKSVKREWVYDGRECIVIKHPKIGHYCGYAKTPLNHLSHTNITYQGDNHIKLIEVHGGITYGPDEDGFVGFDCGHAGDICWSEGVPHDTFSLDKDRDDKWRNDWEVEDVVEEVEYLADQLSALEQFLEANGEIL